MSDAAHKSGEPTSVCLPFSFVTKLEAGMRKQADKAASGDPKALELLLELIRREEKLRDIIKAEYEERWAEYDAEIKSAREKLFGKLGIPIAERKDTTGENRGAGENPSTSLVP